MDMDIDSQDIALLLGVAAARRQLEREQAEYTSDRARQEALLREIK